MTAKIDIDTPEAYDWALENGISFVDWDEAMYLGEHDLFDESYCPTHVYVDYELEDLGCTYHPWGETYVKEDHGKLIVNVEVEGKEVTTPDWLIEQLPYHEF